MRNESQLRKINAQMHEVWCTCYSLIHYLMGKTVILAYSRDRNFFYAYYALKTLTSMICEGGVLCLANAYLVIIYHRLVLYASIFVPYQS